VCKFRIAEGNTIAFEVREYDKDLLLVIDPPTRLWGTYYGGSGDDKGYAVAVDGSGNVYLAGATSSTDAIATINTHQSSLSGNKDAFLTKFSSAGVRRWSTYYGGSNIDEVRGLTIDFGEYIYLSGLTNSNDVIATPGAHQTFFGGGYDAFLVKFNTNGIRQWGTYYGGSNNDYGLSVATDHNGNVYLVGETNSNDEIATYDAIQPSIGGIKDAFLVKFTSSGTRQWGTYYGGEASEWIRSVVTDIDGNVYLAGYTGSTNLLVTFSAHQTFFAGGTDAFLAKFNDNGTCLWATYYGGNEMDFGRCIATDANGNVYLLGDTWSTDNIATSDAYQLYLGGSTRDVFLVKFNSNGIREWGTYYGGNDNDFGYSIATDVFGNIYLTGYTYSPNAIATNDAYQNLKEDSADAYLAKFNKNGALLWGSYYGGSNNDFGSCIAIDSGGSIYLVGWTESMNGISTLESHQNNLGGLVDAFVVKFVQENATHIDELLFSKLHRNMFVFELIPNPAEDNVLLRVWSLEDCKIDIVLTNILGMEQVVVKDKEIKAGTTDISLDLNEHSSGFYLITVRSGKASATKVLQVVK